MWRIDRVRDLAKRHVHWTWWEALIDERQITLDRPRGSRHPEHPTIIYPIDYGYVNGTRSTDGKGIDVFVGTASTGLVGTVITIDHRQHDAEFKLLYDCSPEEVYLVNGFLNFDRRLMEGVLVLRFDMPTLRQRVKPQSRQ